MRLWAEKSRRCGGFTLVELMISIALVLLLLVGINKVFQYTTQAVGAGQTMTAAVRDSRAAQAVFSQDLGGCATTDGPFIIIHNAQVYAFRNRADMVADKDQDASTVDLAGSGIEGDQTVPGDIISPATYNYRNHRVDTLSFFSRGLFPAQTGDSQFVYPNVGSSEARIWYGFLKLPNNTYANPTDSNYVDASGPTETYRYPGMAAASGFTSQPNSFDNATNNPNNFFATDWVLGRVATLLLPSPSVSNYYSYNYSDRGMWTSADGTPPLSPIGNDNANYTYDSANNIKWYQRYSRFDVAQTSISNYSSQLAAYISANYASNLAYGGWAANMYVGAYGKANGTSFQCNPFITTFSTAATNSTLTPPEAMARATPYFLKGCTQFTVEYAGDFVTQQNNPSLPTYGQVTDLVTTSASNGDGIDFELVPTYSSAGTLNPRSLWQKRIRWYGLPRNLSGGLAIPGNPSAYYNPAAYAAPTFTGTLADTAANAPNPPTLPINDSTSLTDVVPLRDVVACIPAGAPQLTNVEAAIKANNGGWIEHLLPGDSNSKGLSNYANTASGGANGMANGSDYLVAWGPDSDAVGIPRPKMIRITITLDDPASPLRDGQTYQYVFTLPQ